MKKGALCHGIKPLVKQKGQEEDGDEEADGQEIKHVKALHADFNKVVARGPGDDNGGQEYGCTFFAHDCFFLLMVDSDVSGEEIKNDVSCHKNKSEQGGVDEGRLGHDADADE